MATPPEVNFQLEVTTRLEVADGCRENCNPQARVEKGAEDEAAEFSVHHAINVATWEPGDPEFPGAMVMEVTGQCSGPVNYCGQLLSRRCGISIESAVRPVAPGDE